MATELVSSGGFSHMRDNSKPTWLRVRVPAATTQHYAETSKIVKDSGLHTVCEEAACPNIAECWNKKHATFMLLGSVCTRACRFCNVATGKPDQLDPHEPEKVAGAVKQLGLKHVVLTSVDRDDLEDGGASHFAETVTAIRKVAPGTTIEVLTPDFWNKEGAVEIVARARPDVYNHNVETVPSLYRHIRPGARYFHSLRLLQRVKELDAEIVTKSGMMLGLGERHDEILQVMDDLRAADVDCLTLGQYLRPTENHAEVKEYVTPEKFEDYKVIAESKGFVMVASGPLVRSSYHAEDVFNSLRAKRKKFADEVPA